MIRNTARAVFALVLAFGSAQATILTQTFSQSIAVQSTNWTDMLNMPLFNPALGTLLSIDFELTGMVQGDAQFESLDSSPNTVNTQLSALITLSRPDLSTILTATPAFTTTDSVTAFDGTIDFGGTSGKTYSNQSANTQTTATSPPPASDLLLFTGIGTIGLPASAVATSSAQGPGNLTTLFSTEAGADLKITYTYDDRGAQVIPEPAISVMVGGGLLGLGLLSRRKR
jgi:hypothetical protein